MSPIRLYVPVPLVICTTITLTGTPFNHAVRVMRLKSGAPLILFNGEGGEFQATLTTVRRHKAEVHIASFDPRETESPLRIILAQGLSRGERMDYTLQKATELGVSEILPLFTERSTATVAGERLEKRLQHWRGVVIGACEQCGRNRLPTIRKPQGLRTWLTERPDSGCCFVLDPGATLGLKTIDPGTGPIFLLVGPEGGLSPGEMTLAEEAGFQRTRLGPRIMRTETAGIAALAVLQSAWGDLD